MTSSIIYGIIPIVCVLVLNFLAKRTNKAVAANIEGQYTLRMHKLYNIVGLVTQAMGMLFVASVFFVEGGNAFYYVMVFLMLLLLGGLGTLCVLYYRRHYIVFDDHELIVQSPFGLKKTISWNDIRRGKFSSNSGLLSLFTGTGDKVKVHYHLVGFPKFVEYLEEYTSLRASLLKLPLEGRNFE